MKKEALSKITYGLYLVCSGDKNRGNGFVSNTFFQVTSSPAQFAACCNKDNYTAEFIERSGYFTVSVLHQNTDSEVFSRFGYKSGRDIEKMTGMNVIYGSTGTPIVLDGSVATMELKLVQKIDVGTHWMFIGELINSEMIDEENDPITYDYYRKVKKGVSPKNAPTYIATVEHIPTNVQVAFSRYECNDCGYIYDDKKEGVKFIDLPDDWKCPVCGAGKSDFTEF
ncbi:MAG: flavin reductase [Paludibacter sp.]